MPRRVDINIWNKRKKRRKKMPVVERGPTGDYAPKARKTLSSLDDKCKRSIWLYDWLHEWLDYLANTPEGNDELEAINDALSTASGIGLRASFKRLVAAIVVALLGTPGPTPDDPALVAVAFILAEAAAWYLEGVGIIPQYTPAEVDDVRAKVAAAKNDIICGLYESGPDFVGAFDAELNKLNITFEQYVLCKAVCNYLILSILYYTAEWWPSYENDYLAFVAVSCC